MASTIKVERFAAGGMVVVAERLIAASSRAAERSAAKAMLDDCYCNQPGFDPLRVTVNGMAIDTRGVRDSAHLESLYRATR